MPDLDQPDSTRQVLENLIGYPFITGNAIEPLRNGDEIFPAMLAAIESAQYRIEFLTFVYWSGDIAERFAHALAERASQGIEVRVILDAMGAKAISGQWTELMEQSGVDLQWFRPIVNWKFWNRENRTHRKVLIVDGEIGFTGGAGIAGEWEGDARNENEWRETHFRLIGPIIKSLQGAFYDNWADTGRRLFKPIPHLAGDNAIGTTSIMPIRASASSGWSDLANLFELLISTAQKRLWIVSAYFVPNEATCNNLIEAVQRGVDIQVMMPGQHTDERVSQMAGEYSFEPLIKGGVKLWKYERTMLHAKYVIADDSIACVGSANFNQRSLRKDDELALVVDSVELVNELHSDFNDDLQHCRRLTEQNIKQRGLWQRVLELLGRLVRSHT